MSIILNSEKQLKTMNLIFGIAGGLWALWTAWEIYRNHWWKPSVSVISVDYVNGIAELMVNGTQRKLYEGSTLAAGADWGVRFGGNKDDESRRIELINNDLVHDVLHEQAGNENTVQKAA